ncbi:MAG: acyl-CoA dehydratase activase [Peptococcaceae bacterium]|jgi:benzoyl-CoA reductase subunit A|nr:acyl-CoA dehydratase activase [Peptococcaceae bacterium]
MTREYSKWPETSWLSDSVDWRKAKTVAAGVDIGTTSAQAVVICDGELYGYASIHTGTDFKQTAEEVLAKATGNSGMTVKDIGAIGATGFGKINAGYASKSLDEVHCHGKGARFLYGPEVTTVVDLGAQTVKAIRLYEWDRVRDFMMNDICATGMGRNVEMVCDLLHVPITEIGEKSLALDGKTDPEPVSTTCYNFASTETMGLFRPEYRAEPLTENEVYASHLFALAWRILGVIGKLQPLDVGDIKVYEKLGFTGGLAKNSGVTKRIERELKTTALTSDWDPMLAGAIGAAILASE